ncbi:hypothetical protein GS4_05_03290 [Gordonia soli NBRC 108243]|uniref:Uncharacterized protein n=1 Tax=Gordonia soli NBRC 108243 TaxID=1223545 RepID=M0QFM5_9ACTN|nr:hypothetical protein GS4_05_03290 [Gordonia soli NBRC 108243]
MHCGDMPVAMNVVPPTLHREPRLSQISANRTSVYVDNLDDQRAHRDESTESGCCGGRFGDNKDDRDGQTDGGHNRRDPSDSSAAPRRGKLIRHQRSRPPNWS